MRNVSSMSSKINDGRIIKRQKNNEYLLVNGLWVRNFANNVAPRDLNNLTTRTDHRTFIDNELALRTMNIPVIGSESLIHRDCIIVSDGHRFDEMKHLLSDLPEKVCVIGVNRSLAKWQTTDEKLLRRKMNYYVVNNPYEECMRFMPQHGYRPKLIVSSRTNPSFVKRYGGIVYKYPPVGDDTFTGEVAKYYQIDDYRNPICAAVGLAYRFGVRRLLLFCCDDVFATERPAAEQLSNGLWMYPQHKISHDLISGNMYWLTQQQDIKVTVGDCSEGPIYDNVPYIPASNFLRFFNEQT